MNISTNQLLIRFIVIIWVVEIINWLLNHQLNQFGILPRDPKHLLGIVSAPFLHGGFYHLINNTLAFITLGWIASLYNETGRNFLLKLTIFVAFLGGALTWLLARPHLHVGLSGVIFGYWGFLTVNGFFEKSLKAIFISFIVLILYGGMFFGLLPTSPHISFESHIFGALSGVIYSYLHRKRRS